MPLPLTSSPLDDLASIDDEIASSGQYGVVGHSRPANPADDQATRLRQLLRGESAVASVVPRSETSVAMPRWTPPAAAISKRHAKIIAVASGKGGVGKTNIAVNLAIALAAKNLRVTLLDADLGTANADLLCGISPSARLDHIIAPGGLAWQDGAKRTIRDIAIPAPGGFKLVPGAAGIARLADLSAQEQRTLILALRELERDADVLIVDAAAGVGRAVTLFVEAADLGLIATTPEPTALADAYALTKCAMLGRNHTEGRDESPLALVVNQVRDPLEAFAVHARFSKVCERFLGATVPMLGFVAQDLRVPESVRVQKPFVLHAPECPAALNICELGSAVINRLGLKPGAGAALVSNKPNRGVGALVRRLLGFSSEVG